MSSLFSIESQTDGPKWLFTEFGLDFEVPFTRTPLSFGWWLPSLMTWVSSLFFVFFVMVIAPAIKPSKKETIKTFAFYHYCALFIYSLATCIATIWLIVAGEEWTTDKLYCNVTPDWYRAISISFMLSKYWEWLDTAILVWEGKSLYDIGFLHFYHHMTTVTVFSVTMNMAGADKIGIGMNSFVHTLMYYHYAFRLPKQFRPIITFAQILQLYHGSTAYSANYYRCVQYKGLEDAPLAYHALYATVPIYLLFFIRFFFQTYVFGTTTPPRQRNAINNDENVIDDKQKIIKND